MILNFGDAGQLYSKQLEAVSAAAMAMANGWQQFVLETTDYAKQSCAKNRAFAERLLHVGDFSEGLRLQSEFAKSASQDLFAQANKVGNLSAECAKDVFKPVTSLLSTDGYSETPSPAE